MDNRVLLPFYVITIMSLLGAFALWHSAWFRARLRFLQIVPWLLAAICIGWYFPQTRDKVASYHQGAGYTAFHWDRSALIQAVRNLPPGKAVISDEWELLLLWTGRPIYDLWNTFPSTAPIQHSPYGTDPRDSTQSLFCDQGAALVIFNKFQANFKTEVGAADQDPLPDLFSGLSVSGVYPDGIIYLCP
jgi:hypothetical protein